MFKKITIHGNIGSGKTTLMNNLKNYYNNNYKIVFIDESVAEWENFFGKNMLKEYYENIKKNSFIFNILVGLTTHINTKKYLEKLQSLRLTDELIISERSLESTLKVFVETNYNSNDMDKQEYEIIKQLFKLFDYKDIFFEEYIIYLFCSPEIAFTRLQKGDTTKYITYDYLKLLHNNQNNMISNIKNTRNYNSDNLTSNEIFEDVIKYIDRILLKSLE